MFGNNRQICEDLTILLGDEIVKMAEGESVILLTLKSTENIANLKLKISEANSPFILIPKEQFKEIALQIDEETLKYLFNTKERKPKKVKEEPVVLDLNTILDKINKTGYNSLKKEEKDFLKTLN
jgi:chromatin remodeling complex protein RSC6